MCLLDRDIGSDCQNASRQGNRAYHKDSATRCRQPCSSWVAQQAKPDREPKPIGLGPVTIDQIEIGRIDLSPGMTFMI